MNLLACSWRTGWRIAAPLLLVCGAHATQRTCEYTSVLDAQYAFGQMSDGALMPLFTDVYQPTSCLEGPAGPAPAIILLPGGGFGDAVAFRRSPPMLDMADGFARDGFVVFVAEYRNRNWHGHTAVSETMTDAELRAFREIAAQGPYPVETAFQGLIATEDTYKLHAWIESQAAVYGVDVSSFGIIGPSSGSSTALTTAYMGNDLDLGDPRLNAVVDLWGDFYPHEMMTGDEAPLLMVAGTKDAVIEYPYTTETMDRAAAVGLDATRITMKGVGHGLPAADIFHRKVVGTGGMTIFDVVVQFYEAKLRPAEGQVWPPAGQGREMTSGPTTTPPQK